MLSVLSERHSPLGRRVGQNDWLYNRWIVVLRLVDPGRDKPHPHGLRREWPQQIVRTWLVAQPASVVARREDQRHPIVHLRHHFVGVLISAKKCQPNSVS